MSRTYHHGDLKNALLDAADAVLERDGLQGFTLRACAREAGVSHAAPKHHFGDVAGLLCAVAERGYARLVDRLSSKIEAAGESLEAQMQATTVAYVGFAEDFPEHFRIMFRSDLLRFDPSAPPQSALRTFTELTNVILRQRGEPEVTLTDGPQERSEGLVNDILIGWCYVHGYAHLKLEGQLGIVPEGTHEMHMALCSTRLSALIRDLYPV